MRREELNNLLEEYYNLSTEKLNLSLHYNDIKDNNINSTVLKKQYNYKINNIDDRMEELKKIIKDNNNNTMISFFDYIDNNY